MDFSSIAQAMYGNIQTENPRSLFDLQEEHQPKPEQTNPNPPASTPDQGTKPPAPEVTKPSTESPAEAPAAIEDGDVIPDSPDGYELPGNPNPELATWFKGLALEQGLTRQQAFELAQQHEVMAQREAARFDQEIETLRDKTRTELERAWGPVTAANIEQAKVATRALENQLPGFSKWLGMTGMGDDPMMIRLVHLVAGRGGAGRGSLADSLYSKIGG